MKNFRANILAMAAVTALSLTGCSTSPEAQTNTKSPDNKWANAQSTSNHVKTDIPPPFPITTQSLRGERLDRLILDLVKEGAVPGVSVLVYESGKESYFGEAGYSNIDTKTPIKRSDVGRYYSMTKPITGVAMMKLFEQGKFKLDDPVLKYLPEFSSMMVINGTNSDGSMRLTRARRSITIRDLMRHTSGFTYGFMDTPVDKMYVAENVLSYDQSNANFTKALAKYPLLYQPGKKFNYSVSTDVQGRLIEVLSGQTLGAYLQANIFTPLNMNHTGFMVKATDRAKFTPLYVASKNGLNITKDGGNNVLPGGLVDRPFLNGALFESGGGGLVSTIDDYAKFALMLQNQGGSILKPETLALMTKDQLVGIDKGEFGLGSSFGLNFALKTTAREIGEINAPKGTFYWGGIAGTSFFVDEKNDITFIMHMQAMNTNWTQIRARMNTAIYGAQK